MIRKPTADWGRLEEGAAVRTVRTATAVAKTPCRLAVIPEKRFLFMVQTTPHFALLIMKVMADRLRRMNARV